MAGDQTLSSLRNDLSKQATLPRISIHTNISQHAKSDLQSLSGDFEIRTDPRGCSPSAAHKRRIEDKQSCRNHATNPNYSSLSSSSSSTCIAVEASNDGDLPQVNSCNSVGAANYGEFPQVNSSSVIETTNWTGTAAAPAMAEDVPVEDCVTPRGPENQIPEPYECPAPPRKKAMKKHNFYGKRKLIMSHCHDSNILAGFFNLPSDLLTYPDFVEALFKKQ